MKTASSTTLKAALKPGLKTALTSAFAVLAFSMNAKAAANTTEEALLGARAMLQTVFAKKMISDKKVQRLIERALEGSGDLPTQIRIASIEYTDSGLSHNFLDAVLSETDQQDHQVSSLVLRLNLLYNGKVIAAEIAR